MKLFIDWAIRRGGRRGTILMLATCSLLASAPLAPTAALAAGAHVHVHPRTGPAGTQVDVSGTGFVVGRPCGFDASVHISFMDAAGTFFHLTSVVPVDGAFQTRATIPLNAASGRGRVTASISYRLRVGCDSLERKAGFTVTGMLGDPLGQRGGTREPVRLLAMDRPTREAQ